MILAILICGTVLTIVGYFGPEDGGLLALFGMAMIGIAVWKGVFA